MSFLLQDNIVQLENILDSIGDLPQADLPTLTNEGSPSDFLYGKEFVDSKGRVVSGTLPVKGSSDITVNDTVVNIPSGYYDELVEKTVDATVQAAPNIIVDNTSGLITATTSQSTGYVFGGIKTSTHQLAFQPARTITPSTVSQVAVSSGYFTGGDVIVEAIPTQSKSITPTSVTQTISPDTGKFLSQVTIAGDSSLKPENIKNGITIFNTMGILEEEWSENEDAIINKSIKTYTNSRVSFIDSYAFCQCYSLTSVSFPAATTISTYAFGFCSALTTISFPKVTTIGNYAFRKCGALTSVSFPAATTIGGSAFYSCFALTSANFPAVTTIGSDTFRSCYALTTVSFPAATTISDYAFANCSSLVSVSFPKVTTISDFAFAYSPALTTANFPAATTIGDNVFFQCYSLTTISFPKVTTISYYAFHACSGLTTISFPALTNIRNSAFGYCPKLSRLYLMGSILCKLSSSKAFAGTGITSTAGAIYVPASLLASYKAATNWAYFSKRFVGA